MEAISRLYNYYRHQGLRMTFRRAWLWLARSASLPRMILFQCDLTKASFVYQSVTAAGNLRIERKSGEQDLADADTNKILNFWNPTIARRNMAKRFQNGATLWLIRCNELLAGFGWTLIGRTMESHYFPIGANDAHLFDFLVFPEFRGRNLNPLLVQAILKQLADEERSRAFIEAAEWNAAQLRSLSKTDFRLMGMARKVTLFGRTVVQWHEPDVHDSRESGESR